MLESRVGTRCSVGLWTSHTHRAAIRQKEAEITCVPTRPVYPAGIRRLDAMSGMPVLRVQDAGGSSGSAFSAREGLGREIQLWVQYYYLRSRSME